MSKITIEIMLEVPDGVDISVIANAAEKAANEYLKPYIKNYTKSSWRIRDE